MSLEREEKHYDCLIIGAGLSGMAAAIRLSHFGKKVLLVEKNSNLGGLNTYYYKNGVEIDSGLHAMTNFCGKGGDNSLPLNKLLRQLRIRYDELNLVEQIQSEIKFPRISLTFDNNFLETQKKIKILFNDSSGQFDKLVNSILNFDAFLLEKKETQSARKFINTFLNNRSFEDMILLPLMYYGNASEEDMELSQFIIMFRSIFMEGLCRPEYGIKTIIDILKRKLKENNCDISNRNAVVKIFPLNNGELKILLSNGSTLIAEKVISCIGYNETLELVDKSSLIKEKSYGQITFCEAIFYLKELAMKKIEDFKNACTFFCETDKFEFKRPSKAYSTESGVFCVPANFKYLNPNKKLFFLRLTTLANFEYWLDESPERYMNLKLEFEEEALAKIAKLLNTKISREDISFSDTFTPRTILRWTGHKNGAIYGSPVKAKDGKTEVPNLYVCGTDQGFLGITGSILSGISIANKYALQ